jgi:hypothetical protein
VTPHPDDLLRLAEAQRLLGDDNFTTLWLWRVMVGSKHSFRTDNAANHWIQRMVKAGRVRKVVRGLFTFAGTK